MNPWQVDPELAPSTVYSERKNLLASGLGAGVAVAILLGMIHGLSFCIILSIATHAALIAGHIQVYLFGKSTKP